MVEYAPSLDLQDAIDILKESDELYKMKLEDKDTSSIIFQVMVSLF